MNISWWGRVVRFLRLGDLRWLIDLVVLMVMFGEIVLLVTCCSISRCGCGVGVCGVTRRDNGL
jgi:hypothetical protein